MASGVELKKPKRKKNCGACQRDPSFPIPIASITGKPACQERWYRYFGTLRGDTVAVDRLGDMTFLYKMGFFGKGNLSKSKPEFDQFSNTFDERCKERICKTHSRKLTEEQKEIKKAEFDLIHNERMKQHAQWALQMPSEEGISTKQSRMDDVYEVDEFLQLSLEEAFFLSFGLGCLTISSGDKTSFEIPELWNKFREIKPRFVETYATYHYFRSMGWIVRDGMIYGSDFVLYKEGMPFYHSSYAVLTYLVDDGRIGGTADSLPWSWSHLTCINRVAEHVAKDLLISLVVKPRGLTVVDLSSPRCLAQFEVQEVLFRRWISERHRDGSKGN